ncbi:MAG: type II toxin-antitoxin system Phd/YefM family antitoxin [Patescibacteria group bacterium]|nr:type II toxin-antitoxin system Phd/YefM family antitoxin [Patescibacteria group bacterium]
MNASFVDLRKKSSEIIRALHRNEPVTVMYRGKPAAVMQPIGNAANRTVAKASDHPSFGLWAKRDDLADVAAYVRNLRKRRFDDL